MTDITAKPLTVSRLYNVVKSSNNRCGSLITINGRRSDAFVYIISGSCTYTVDGTSFTVEAGDVLYLSNNSVYTMYIHTSDYRFIFCDFEFIEPEKRKCDYYRNKNAEWEALFTRLIRFWGSEDANAYCEAMSLLYRIYGAVIFEANKRYVSSGTKDKINNARSYIDAHFADPELSVALLAEKANMSQVYFRKTFRSQIGVSPSQYVSAVRLTNAKKLMEYQFLTLEECASASGFLTVQYFCRVFKKEFGTTPAKYRKIK